MPVTALTCRVRAALAACALAACAAPLPASPDGAAGTCARAAECDDGRFCNGAERCEPAAAGADARGCAPATVPCGAEERCDELLARCVPIDCAVDPDGDGDGHAARACGGDDCDDADVARHPGAIEICDADAHDEDCDPETFGVRDADGDGWADARCCNGDAGADRRCGPDCDDAHAGVGPGTSESCDEIDDDCDGAIDEGVRRTLYADLDGDGYGDGAAPGRDGCWPLAGESEIAGDCDDRAPSVSPGAREVCDVGAIDEDCDGAANPASRCECAGAASAPCGLPGLCASGVRRCIDGRLGGCTIAPIAESCDGRDEDCDGATDEGATVGCWADADNDGFAASGAARAAHCPVAGREARGGCPAGHTDRDPAGAADCADEDATARPGASEVCDGGDDDCDGSTDEGLTIECYGDADGDGYAASAARAPRCRDPISGGCPSGSTALAPSSSATTDCDDASAARAPGRAEICDLADGDCDGTIDEGLATTTRYFDRDGDGFGREAIVSCVGPGTVANGLDCNDEEPRASPAQTGWLAAPHCTAAGVCSFDWDCDGTVEPRPASECASDGLLCLDAICMPPEPAYTGSPACGASVAQVRCCRCPGEPGTFRGSAPAAPLGCR